MTFLENTDRELDRLRDYIYAPGVLDKKTKYLIALSNCIALGCEPCTIHKFKTVKDELDCTEAEIEEAVSIAIMNAAGTTRAKAMAAWNKM